MRIQQSPSMFIAVTAVQRGLEKEVKDNPRYLSNGYLYEEEDYNTIMEKNYLRNRSETPGPYWLSRGQKDKVIVPKRSKTPTAHTNYSTQNINKTAKLPDPLDGDLNNRDRNGIRRKNRTRRQCTVVTEQELVSAGDKAVDIPDSSSPLVLGSYNGAQPSEDYPPLRSAFHRRGNVQPSTSCEAHGDRQGSGLTNYSDGNNNNGPVSMHQYNDSDGENIYLTPRHAKIPVPVNQHVLNCRATTSKPEASNKLRVSVHQDAVPVSKPQQGSQDINGRYIQVEFCKNAPRETLGLGRSEALGEKRSAPTGYVNIKPRVAEKPQLGVASRFAPSRHGNVHHIRSRSCEDLLDHMYNETDDAKADVNMVSGDVRNIRSKTPEVQARRSKTPDIFSSRIIKSTIQDSGDAEGRVNIRHSVGNYTNIRARTPDIFSNRDTVLGATENATSVMKRTGNYADVRARTPDVLTAGVEPAGTEVNSETYRVSSPVTTPPVIDQSTYGRAATPDIFSSRDPIAKTGISKSNPKPEGDKYNDLFFPKNNADGKDASPTQKPKDEQTNAYRPPINEPRKNRMSPNKFLKARAKTPDISSNDKSKETGELEGKSQHQARALADKFSRGRSKVPEPYPTKDVHGFSESSSDESPSGYNSGKQSKGRYQASRINYEQIRPETPANKSKANYENTKLKPGNYSKVKPKSGAKQRSRTPEPYVNRRVNHDVRAAYTRSRTPDMIGSRSRQRERERKDYTEILMSLCNPEKAASPPQTRIFRSKSPIPKRNSGSTNTPSTTASSQGNTNTTSTTASSQGATSSSVLTSSSNNEKEPATPKKTDGAKASPLRQVKRDTVYMLDSAHDSSSGIASDDHNGPTSSPPSTSSYQESPTQSHLAVETRGASRRYLFPDIDDEDGDEDLVVGNSRNMGQLGYQTHNMLGHSSDHSSGGDYHATKLTSFQPRSRSIASSRSTTSLEHMSSRTSSQEALYISRNYFGKETYSTKEMHIQDTGKVMCEVKRKSKVNFFALLPDIVITKIFSSLPTDQLCRNSRVCHRWYNLVWDASLWTNIRINNPEIDVDKAIKVLTRRLSVCTPSVCVMVEKITLNGCDSMTDKGLHTIAKRCPELRHLEIQGCPHVTNIALFEVVSRCVNMEHLNVAGCPNITTICLTPEATVQATAYGKQIDLRYLDMTDCVNLEDSGLQILASYCSQLVYLFLRRCVKVTDIGVQYVANYCSSLKELSVSDCRKVTDFGMRELAKLGANLRYLSVAKCDKISDVGVRYIAQYCHKLRYLNVRGCEGVSDDSVDLLARYCRRLKSLDIGKCDVTDDGLQTLAESCPQLRRLSLKACDAITDQGVITLAFRCRQMQQLNIQECHISVEAYRAVKKYCKRCIIEHTNPGFY